MTAVTTAIVVVAMLGCALVGGVFFAFSSFVMKALARVPSAEGIAAMQSINIVVLNRSFLGLFMGTAALCLVIGAIHVVGWGAPTAPWFVAGALLYLVGTFGVTIHGNVPLNDRLAAVDPRDSGATELWQLYLDEWTRFNTIRTVAAAVAALAMVAGLLQGVHTGGAPFAS
jgi:uncharacterized membrane protein